MWEVLCGTLEEVRDLRLEDLGRERSHKRRDPAVGAGDHDRLSGTQLFRAAFAARRDPWRLAMVNVECDFAIPGEPRETDVALVAWAEGLTAIIHGDPAAGEVFGPGDGTFGDHSLGRLLRPQPLEGLVPPPWPAHFQVPGDVLGADEAMFLVPELVTIGADRYEAGFDAAAGVLTSWTALVDDEVATRFRLGAADRLWSSG